MKNIKKITTSAQVKGATEINTTKNLAQSLLKKQSKIILNHLRQRNTDLPTEPPNIHFFKRKQSSHTALSSLVVLLSLAIYFYICTNVCHFFSSTDKK